MNCSAVLKRDQSVPISATSPSAVSVSTPRRQRNRATSSRPRAVLGCRVEFALELPRSAGRRDPARARRSERPAAVGVLEASAIPATRGASTPQDLLGIRSPWRSRNFLVRWRSRIRSIRASSRARTSSRSASTCSLGIVIASSSPPACNLASLRASRGSVLTRSSGRTGTSPGATTSHAIPALADGARARSRSARPHSSSAPAASATPRARPPPGRGAACAHPTARRRAPPPGGSMLRARPARRVPSRTAYLAHGRRPPYVALPGPPRQPTQMRRRRPLSSPTGRSRSTTRLHPL